MNNKRIKFLLDRDNVAFFHIKEHLIVKVFFDASYDGLESEKKADVFITKIHREMNLKLSDSKIVLHTEGSESYYDVKIPCTEIITEEPIEECFDRCDLDSLFMDSYLIGEELVIKKTKLNEFYDICSSHLKYQSNRKEFVMEEFGISSDDYDWVLNEKEEIEADNGLVYFGEFVVFEDESSMENDEIEIQVVRNLDERLQRKVIIRKGKRKRVKRSTKKGFTTRGGKEVKMSAKERRNRRKSQRKGARKRKAKKGKSNRLRAKSMRKRRNIK